MASNKSIMAADKQMEQEFLVGINAVASRLAAGAGGVSQLLVRRGETSPRLRALAEQARGLSIAVREVDDKRLAEIADLNHQGVALAVAPLPVLDDNGLAAILAAQPTGLLLLILDGITDPRNFGACLRSAATLGVQAVIVPKDNSAPLNAAAAKTASGGASVVPVVQVVNLARCMDQLKEAGVWLVGTLLDAEQSLSEVDLTGNVAIVMGSEERGMRQKTRRNCDYLVSIPMPCAELGFNVSVATGICLYEAVRQRQLT